MPCQQRLRAEDARLAMGLIEDEERAEAINFTDGYMSYDILAVYYMDGSQAPFLQQVAASFTKTFIRDNRWQLFLQGAVTTLLISVLSVLFGTVLGLLLYLWVANGKRAEHAVTAIIGWLAGSTPTVVLLMILYYVIFKNYAVSNVAVAIVGFTIVFGCSFYEKILSGVKAVGTGQEEPPVPRALRQVRHFSASFSRRRSGISPTII